MYKQILKRIVFCMINSNIPAEQNLPDQVALRLTVALCQKNTHNLIIHVIFQWTLSQFDRNRVFTRAGFLLQLLLLDRSNLITAKINSVHLTNCNVEEKIHDRITFLIQSIYFTS